MGDLSPLNPDRDAFKAKVAEVYPEKKPGAIPNNAGQLFRFVHEMKRGDFVVYPKHGVGRVVEIQCQVIAGTSLDLFVLRFEKERMTLRVPTNKAESVGMRKLSSQATMNEALTTLKGRPRIKRTMWSRRAQEYEAKINSGDLVSIAEVVRDLHRAEDQPEQSYSERQIYEAAIGRLARELAAMENIDEPAAQQKIEQVLKAA